MRIPALFLICGGLALSNAALAQDTAGAGTSEVTVIGTFDQMSPGNQKIAESLFTGQTISGDGTAEALTLDQIAAAKQDGQGWGQVFKQMKSDGLVEAKNLGQLVSGHGKASRTTYNGGATRSKIVLTNATGRTMSFGKSNRASDRRGSSGGSGTRSGGKKYSGGVSGGFKNQSASISRGGSGGGGSFRGKSGKAK